MNQISVNNMQEILDVPPELRGLSDDEIIRNSEKSKKDFAGKRKNGAARPSKRDRETMRKEQALKEAESMAAEIFGKNKHTNADVFSSGNFAMQENMELSREKKELLETAFTPRSTGYSKVSATLPPLSNKVETKHAPQSMIAEPPKPASGRILKASFGVKGKEQPKAIIVNAADLAKQKAEERAKKVQAFFKSKHPEATTMPDGTPIKRGRGRPRKIVDGK